MEVLSRRVSTLAADLREILSRQGEGGKCAKP
jgi:hypothetical protein